MNNLWIVRFVGRVPILMDSVFRTEEKALEVFNQLISTPDERVTVVDDFGMRQNFLPASGMITMLNHNAARDTQTAFQSLAQRDAQAGQGFQAGVQHQPAPREGTILKGNSTKQ